jgi:hypothetical protein
MALVWDLGKLVVPFGLDWRWAPALKTIMLKLGVACLNQALSQIISTYDIACVWQVLKHITYFSELFLERGMQVLQTF